MSTLLFCGKSKGALLSLPALPSPRLPALGWLWLDMFQIVARAYKVFYNLIYVKRMQNRKAHTNLQRRAMRTWNVAGKRRLRGGCRTQAA